MTSMKPQFYLSFQEERYRSDAILSEIRATLTVITDRLVTESPLAKRKGVKDEDELRSPPRLRRDETEAPPLPRTPNQRPTRTTTTTSGDLSPVVNDNNDLGPLLSPQNKKTKKRVSPRSSTGSSQQRVAAPCRSLQRPPFYIGGGRGGGGGGGRGGGVGVGRGIVSPMEERSPSPPSRSQPLRALVNCEGYYTHREDSPLHRDHNSNEDDVSLHLAGEDDQQYQAKIFRTPKREGRRGEEDRTEERKGRGGRGAIPTSPSPVPRVADLERVRRLALEKKEAKAAEAAALVRRHHHSGSTGNGHVYGKGTSSTRGAQGHHGGTALYHPSWYDPKSADTSVPDSGLALEYVHGYAGETPDVLGSGGSGGHHCCGKGDDLGGGGGTFGVGSGSSSVPGRVGGARRSATRSTNIVWLRSGEIVFPAAAVVVIHDFETNRQRFFTGHDEARLLSP